MQGDDLTNAVVTLEVDDGAWPVVVVHPAPARASGAETGRLLRRLDGVVEREQAFGLVLDLAAAGRGAGVLGRDGARGAGVADGGALRRSCHRRGTGERRDPTPRAAPGPLPVPVRVEAVG